MGLEASNFRMTRTNILNRLNRDTDLTLDHIYSEIVAEERHDTVSRSREERVDAVGFVVKPGVNAITDVARSGTCTHCGRTNHTVENCFQLHGLP